MTTHRAALTLAFVLVQTPFLIAQQGEMNSFMTGVRPQDITYQKVIDVPEMSLPKQQQNTTDRISFRQMISKFVPFISPTVTKTYKPAVPISSNSDAPSAFQPLLPTFEMPKVNASGPFQPLLPTSKFPAPVGGGPLKPVLPNG
jgi:hypothetical protein